MQGGYIYEHQGGPISDPEEEGKDFVVYDKNSIDDKYNVSYDIYRQTEDTGYLYHPDPPEYPWDNFPCVAYWNCVGNRIHLNTGFFGIENLPPLNGSDPSNSSIESQLKQYITNYLENNINLSIFEEQGFDITDGEINVSVIIGDNDIIAFLEYPLVINKTITNKITKVNYFYTNPQVRLKKVYKLVEKIIKNDIVDPTFDIGKPDNDEGSIRIKKEEDVYEHDDVVVIKDEKSMLYAEPYTFQFARENRNPALHLIYMYPLVKDCEFGRITKGDIIPTKAYDPDEDNLTFTYDPELPYLVADLGLNTVLHIKVTVNDEILTDWQEFDISVTCSVLQ